MSDQKLKVGIIGGGGIVRAHLPRLKQRSELVEVAAIADVNAAAAGQTAEEYSIPCHATDYKEWLSDVDAVSSVLRRICTRASELIARTPASTSSWKSR